MKVFFEVTGCFAGTVFSCCTTQRYFLHCFACNYFLADQSARLFLQESRLVMGPKSRRGVFSARPSTASQIYEVQNMPTVPNNNNTPNSQTPGGAISNMSFSVGGRIPKVTNFFRCSPKYHLLTRCLV